MQAVAIVLSYWRQEIRDTGSNINYKKSIIYCFLTVRLLFIDLNMLKPVFIKFEYISYCFLIIGAITDCFTIFGALVYCLFMVVCFMKLSN